MPRTWSGRAVLMFAHYFPPHCGGGVQRTLKFVNICQTPVFARSLSRQRTWASHFGSHAVARGPPRDCRHKSTCGTHSKGAMEIGGPAAARRAPASLGIVRGLAGRDGGLASSGAVARHASRATASAGCALQHVVSDDCSFGRRWLFTSVRGFPGSQTSGIRGRSIRPAMWLGLDLPASTTLWSAG